MVLIKKDKEPVELKNYRSTPNADFDGMGQVKGTLRTALLKEQGYICAYCMRRLKDDYKSVRIEHYEKRNAENQLIYSNLLACCDGGEKENVQAERYTCDKSKGDKRIQINPQNEEHMKTIKYTSTGLIKSSRFQNDLDNVLNLNDPQGHLVRNRAAIIRLLRSELSKIPKGKSAQPKLKELKAKFEKHDKSGMYHEYVGVILWFLNKKLSKN